MPKRTESLQDVLAKYMHAMNNATAVPSYLMSTDSTWPKLTRPSATKDMTVIRNGIITNDTRK